MKQTIEERVKHEREYIDFLTKRLASENFRKNMPPKAIEMTENKLKKARLVLKLLSKSA